MVVNVADRDQSIKDQSTPSAASLPPVLSCHNLGRTPAQLRLEPALAQVFSMTFSGANAMVFAAGDRATFDGALFQQTCVWL